jgi:hypothetical protein
LNKPIRHILEPTEHISSSFDMPQGETYEASSHCDQLRHNNQGAGFTVGELTFEEFRRPEGAPDEGYTTGELRILEKRLEDYNQYRPGGYHPVHLGDTLGHDARYRVLHKLGSGLSSTVWLCQNTVEGKYVAIKIIMADKSKDSRELNYMKLKDLSHEQSGGDKIGIPEDHFWIDGPNGTHLCLILPILGPRVTDLLAFAKDVTGSSRNAAAQVVEGLKLFQRNGICHDGE